MRTAMLISLVLLPTTFCCAQSPATRPAESKPPDVVRIRQQLARSLAAEGEKLLAAGDAAAGARKFREAAGLALETPTTAADARRAKRQAFIERHAGELLVKARALRKAGKMLDAYRHAVQALHIEPLDEPARELAVACLPAAVAQWKREFAAARAGKADGGDAEDMSLSAADRKVLKQFAAIAPPIAFKKTRLDDVAGFLRDRIGLPLHVKWRALEEVGLERTTPVTTTLPREITVETALKILLDDISGAVGREDRLNYRLREGILHISTNTDLEGDAFTVVHNIRGLLTPRGPGILPIIPGYDVPSLVEGSGASGYFLSPPETAEDKAVRLIRMIEEIVWPGHWCPPRDFPARYHQGLLILSLNWRDHRDVRRILRFLRAPLSATGPDRTEESPYEAALRKTLDAPLPKLRFDKTKLEDVVQFLRDATGASIHVKWRALEEVGILKNTPVDLRLDGVTFRTAVSVLLDDVSGAAGQADRLGFVGKSGVLVISTNADLDKETYVRTHDVRDLIAEAVAAEVLAGVKGPAGLFTQPPGEPGTEQREDVFDGEPTSIFLANERSAVADLVDLLRKMIDPESWVLGSPASGDVRYINGILIITQTQRNHRRVEQLLAALRKRLLPESAAPSPPADSR